MVNLGGNIVTNFASKAKSLVNNRNTLKAVVALGVLASSQANAGIINGTDLSIDDMSVGYSDSGQFPGFFSSNFSYDQYPFPTGDSGSITGEAFGDGLKLYGSADIGDRSLYESFINPSEDPDAIDAGYVTGIAFNWIGSFNNTANLETGDKLALDYEFGISFTDAGQSESSVSYNFFTGFYRLDDGYGLFDGQWEGQGFLSSAGDHDIEGTAESGEIDAFLLEEIQNGNVGFFVSLIVNWEDYDDSGDRLSVVIPQNSIDIGVNTAPTAVEVPEPSVPLLFGSAILGMAALRRKIRK